MRLLLPLIAAALLASCGDDLPTGAPADTAAPADLPDVPPAPDVPTDEGQSPDEGEAPDEGETPDVPPRDTAEDLEEPTDLPDADVDTADGTDGEVAEDVEDVPEDTGPPSLCPPATAGALTLTLGRTFNEEFKAYVAGDPIEIQQGPQGGVHLDVTVAIEGLPAGNQVGIVHLETWQAGQSSPVGLYGPVLTSLYPYPAGGHWSAQHTVIFTQDEAHHYQDAACCVRAQITLQGDGAPRGETTLTMHCVDFF